MTIAGWSLLSQTSLDKLKLENEVSRYEAIDNDKKSWKGSIKGSNTF